MLCAQDRPAHVGVSSPKPVTSVLRREVHKRDGGRCQYCGRPGDTLDHVIPRAARGTNAPDNLVTCCKDCNTRKGSQQLYEIASSFATLLREGRTCDRGYPILIVQALLAGCEAPAFLNRSSLIEEGAESVNLALDLFLDRQARRIHRDTVPKHPRPTQVLEGLVLLTAAGLVVATPHYWSVPRGRTLARYQRARQARVVLGALQSVMPARAQHVHAKQVEQAIATALPHLSPERRGQLFQTLARTGVLSHKPGGRKDRDGRNSLLTRRSAFFNRDQLWAVGTIAAVSHALGGS